MHQAAICSTSTALSACFSRSPPQDLWIFGSWDLGILEEVRQLHASSFSKDASRNRMKTVLSQLTTRCCLSNCIRKRKLSSQICRGWRTAIMREAPLGTVAAEHMQYPQKSAREVVSRYRGLKNGFLLVRRKWRWLKVYLLLARCRGRSLVAVLVPGT